ncbi:hypothetical protein TGME49_245740 [Toxoplasma gondii ME49]|uniref:Transmembrane protein n=3 Tax=Toxoplasma gondii TaxID=5811 RepID=B6KGM9_TOXGV|nr:hypothetical protein TGME49_245740 [Toxoplasma gondii ME49]EPT24816.1 hypothetical protein TGME49_245740 [Toxoplasma gondii ME49]ESS34023.1 hypothetical protein TGVEG_245740 [Toxoplasma gondii VEG]KFG47104.1 hypothetical protein TGDOM2_245740 [Toxoplasma gondii GAB2-2007-GAL-DOM2]CEL78292.1 TPA: hypothetical protein BN1205_006160 [Toxoplasma gondii VEG]|eukprot:XP_002367002.1 hypothetical protein TGME49_245740 [Toxoplasma gondii ME49]
MSGHACASASPCFSLVCFFSQPLVASSSGNPHSTFPPSSQRDSTPRLRSLFSPPCLPSPQLCILPLAAPLLFMDPSGLASHGRSSLLPSSITSCMKIVGSTCRETTCQLMNCGRPVSDSPVHAVEAQAYVADNLGIASLQRKKEEAHVPSHKPASAEFGYLFIHGHLCARPTDVSR